MSGSPEAPVGQARIDPLLRRPEAIRAVYQPIVQLLTGETAGYEALTRIADWPARSPLPWFQAAARAGVAPEFQAAALREGLLARDELPPGRYLSLNIDPELLKAPAVTGALLDEPDLHGVVLELTSSDASPQDAALVALRARGVLVAARVTDAGHGELREITELRPDIVQLGPALIHDVHQDALRERLVRLTARVSAELGAVTLALGIEELAQAVHLQWLGIDLGQGWLFGRARPGFREPSVEATGCLRAAGLEYTARNRVGALAVPAVTLGWQSELDGSGRLRTLTAPDGRVFRPHHLCRLRAGQDLRTAALRVVASDGAFDGPESAEVAPVIDRDGSLVGVTPIARLLAAALAASDSA